MSNHISFDSSQEVTLVAKQTISVDEVTPQSFVVSIVPVKEKQGNDIVTVGENICVHAHIEGARVSLSNICGSDQSAANAAFQPAVDILVAQLKSAIESGDYNG